MDDLPRLVDRDAIRELALRYALAVDGKDLDALASLFAPDVDNGRFGRGPDGVRRFYDQSLRKFHCSMHLVANHVIELDDSDHAHGVVYCLAQHHVLEPEHWFDEALAYWDTYERIGGKLVLPSAPTALLVSGALGPSRARRREDHRPRRGARTQAGWAHARGVRDLPSLLGPPSPRVPGRMIPWVRRPNSGFGRGCRP